MSITTYRKVSGANQNETFTCLNWDEQILPYAASILINTTNYDTDVVVGLLTGALTLTANVTSPLIGDLLHINFSSTAGETVTFSTGFAYVTSTLVVPAAGEGAITFRFNGNAWAEQYRAIPTT
jgi:uncharacterized transporter YbjL